MKIVADRMQLSCLPQITMNRVIQRFPLSCSRCLILAYNI